MRVHLIHAHHEPRSFCSALANRAATTLTEAGHEVDFSDLHSMQFDPVSDRRNFLTTKNPDYLKQQAEEGLATAENGFSPEIESEMQKLEQADALIFNFPLWWFGMPAILKGWVDRVLAAGRIYGGSKLYEGGLGGGQKRAMVIMTTGGGAAMYNGWGVNPSMEAILTPIHHGVFWFNGFRPLEPFLAWSPARIGDDQRQRYLEQLDVRLQNLFEESPRTLPPLADFPDFGPDQKLRFQVVVKFNRPLDSEFHERVPSEQARLHELKREGKLLELARTGMQDPQPRVFLKFRASSVEEVEAWMQSLPLHSYLDYEISHLANPEE